MERFELVQETPVRWRIPIREPMRVPGIVFASEALLPEAAGDRSLDQVASVATLPGIVKASYAMPDVHWGYGFPIGGVAATDPAEGGVVSPGGVGFDISCGVRLLTAPLTRDDLGHHLGPLMDVLGATIPRGLGKGAVWHVEDDRTLDAILTGGADFAVRQGFGTAEDLARTEDRGVVADADPAAVSAHARERGIRQVGSLGSGNHFLEVQFVETVYDTSVASALSIHEGQVCVMIHCGSRGLGHQICQDHVRRMQAAMDRYGIWVPDRQLACAPVASEEGRSYLAAMAAAANFGRANRQLLTEATRDAFAKTLGQRELALVYDVSHNLAKIEEHYVGGEPRRLCVHRKGATRALPPGHPDLPDDLRAVGQPVLVPGSMGTASYVLTGTTDGAAFHSSAHGAGRTMSRGAAKRAGHGGAQLRRELEDRGIAVRALSQRDLPEEAPYAYKDVDEVVAVCDQAGLGRRIARLRPLGVVKG